MTYLMTGVLGVMGFAMVGFYLPLTIYFQSALGLSAVAAGLAVAPQPLAMIVSSSIGGALSDRISHWVFVPGLVIAGLGMGWVWVPVFSLATQELGSVLATAVIGAFLSSRLAVTLHEQAVAQSAAAGLPAGVRAQFVDGVDRAASSGLQVGANRSAALPAGTPADLAQRLQHLGHHVFASGFVHAMKPAMLIPVALILAGAVMALGVRRPKAELEPATAASPERETGSPATNPAQVS